MEGATGDQSGRRRGTPWIARVEKAWAPRPCDERRVPQIAFGAHQSVVSETLQGLGRARLGPVERLGQSPAQARRPANAGEGGARIAGDGAQQDRLPSATSGGHREAVMGEHLLDGVVLVVAQTAEHDEPRLLRGLGQEQLGHDLLRAGEVEQLDIGEVQQGGEAVGAGEGDFDAAGPRRRWGG